MHRSHNGFWLGIARESMLGIILDDEFESDSEDGDVCGYLDDPFCVVMRLILIAI